MKIYCNGDRPQQDAQKNWINYTFEAPDSYTLIEPESGILDIRINTHRDVAVYIPLDERYKLSDFRVFQE